MYYLRAHIWLLAWLDFHGFPKITSSRETHVPPLLFATVTPNARSDVYFRAEQAFCSPVTQTARCLPSENHLWKIWQTKKQAGSPFNPVPLPFFRLSFVNKPAEFFSRPRTNSILGEWKICTLHFRSPGTSARNWASDSLERHASTIDTVTRKSPLIPI